jgi:HK97 family phage prohead protease
METIETRAIEVELRFDKETRQLSGIAVPYGQVTPAYNERFAPGSVHLDENALLLWQHDQRDPVGKILAGRDKDNAFHFDAFISDTTRGRDAATLAADGVLSLSVGFIMRDSHIVDGVTEVRDALVKEISLVSFPAYAGATVTAVRDDTEPEVPDSAPIKEENMEDTTSTASDLAEVREAIQHLEREVAGINAPAPAPIKYRSAGDFLQAIVNNDENAVAMYERAYTGSTTADSVTTPIDVDLIRLVEAANPLGSVFGTGVTPATGMNITFAVVDGVTDGTATQAAEGDDLGYYELRLDTFTENIITVGNYSELSRQVIDRSSVDYLNSVLRGQAIALGKALATQLRTKYQAVCAAQVIATNKVTLANTTYDGWVGGLADASATYFTPNGVQIDALIVDKATFKDLLALDGTPVISFAGEAAGAVGSANVSGLRGTIAGIPIIVDAGLDSVNKDECAFVSSLALRQYTSGALRLSQENAVNLSEAFSLSTYTATAGEYPAFIIPIDQTA